MDFSLTDAQQTRVEEARAFAADRLAPRYQAREQELRIEPEIVREMGRLGLIAPEMPVEFGGRGESRLTSGLLTEAVATGDFNVGYLQVVGSLVAQILAGNATPEVAQRWAPFITSGEGTVGIGLSEPHAGSDAGNPQLRATRDGDDYVLDGVKSMSLCGGSAAAVVFARTSEDRRGRGISAFLVELEQDGVRKELVPDMGTKCVERGLVHFDHVRVPAAHLLGAEGQGFTQVMQGFDFSRALIGLQCIGAAQQTVDETWTYVSQRSAFDKPLSTFQGVSFPLAECETKLATARLLCYQTLWLKDAGMPHTTQAAMSKWYAPKVSYEVINECLLLHGQFGYRTDRPIEQRLRDVLGLQIGDGTAQIMKLIIARQRLGRDFAP